MAGAVETGRITTDIPARLDRLPWARWHWLVVIGLGTVWILDGLEVTIVGSMSEALKPESTGLGMSSYQIGVAGAVYVAGACIGALFFGQLTDRFGRKKLFLITLGVYTVATVLTAFSMNPTWYFAARFLTGAGIGGEYAAINSAIDELIPAQFRGRVDIAINGSFWIGAAGGALLTIPLLDPTLVDPAWGWRIAFGLGAILAVGILIVRRNVPESPRWLFIHGREDEGEQIVRDIERTVTEETGQELPSDRRDDHDPAAAIDQHPRDRADRVHALPAAHDAVLLVVRGPGVPLQRLLLHLRRHADDVLRRQADRLLHRRLRAEQLRRRAAARAAVRQDRPGPDDRRDLHPLRGAAGGRRGRARRPQRGLADRLRRGHLLLRLGGCQCGVPHRQRDLPDGDPGAVHRVLLRDRYGGRRHQRPAAVRQADRRRLGVQGHHGDRDRLLHRRRADDRRRHRRGRARRQGRGAVAGEHRQPLTAEDEPAGGGRPTPQRV